MELMSESVKGAPQPKYEGQPTPFLKHRQDKDAHRELLRRNQHIQRKLNEIKKEPPAAFHAPKGYESVREGAQQSRGGALKGPDGVDVWPPTMPQPAHNNIKRSKEQRAMDLENVRMQKKLEEVYRSKNKTVYGQNKALGTAIDCTARWTVRTSVYTPPSEPSGSAPTTRRPASASRRPTSATPAGTPRQSQQRPLSAPRQSQQRPLSAPRQSQQRPLSASLSTAARAMTSKVPKTLGVAACAGCGSKAFHKADGPGLVPCQGCGKVFYCSDTCQKTDFQSHKALCKYYSTGVWQPYGRRPADDYWVNNAGMAKARHELKSRKALNQSLSVEGELEEQERVAEVVKQARAEEKAAQERQAKIEWRAYWGLDGPRPCMYMAGKKI